MKSWKKRWQDELDAAIPALREDVKNAPIPAPEYTENVKFSAPVKPWYLQLFSTPKRIASCLSACAIGLFAVGASIFFLQPDAPLTASAEVISVEVNPQAVFTVDGEGKVTSVVAVNADADVVLADGRHLEMVGQTVENATLTFVDYTARLGFIDLYSQGAVRITSCAENGWLSEVGDALASYFCEQGAYIAVAEETVEMQAFCERVNMQLCESVETLKSSLERIPALTFEREAEGKDGEELQEIYRENVPFEGIKEIFHASVKAVETRVEKFMEIVELSDSIIAHEDNPGLFYRDYWDLQNKQIPDTMSALMAEMREKLAAYKQEYGIEIIGLDGLIEEGKTCSVTVVQTLTNALLDASLELFVVKIEEVSVLLENLGVDTAVLEDLLTVPETTEEYLNKVEEYAKQQYELLEEKHRDAYESMREEISQADYEAYLSEKIAEFGDLSEYFKNS